MPWKSFEPIGLQSSGQFFTDGRVTKLAIGMLQFDPLNGDDLVDICSGTGGFILAGYDHIRALVWHIPADQQAAKIVELASGSLFGQEVDPEICEVANASFVSRLGTTERPIIQRGDSINPLAFKDNDGPLREGTHRCCAANPPFGTKITIKNKETLAYFELAKTRGERVTPTAPDILLLERNVKMLEPGVGRLGIVLPYQILSGPQTQYVRQWLLANTHIQGIVDLPPETFQPHTGTKTTLLVVRRRAEPETDLTKLDDETIFMSTPRWIGHDRRGRPVHRRTPDGKQTTEILSDIEDVGRAFAAFLEGAAPSATHCESFTTSLSRSLPTLTYA